jgi:acyl-coenzyme A synthetase/AMP-(fatty) acid ligase
MTGLFQILEKFRGRTAVVTDEGREVSYEQLIELSGEVASLLNTGSIAFCLCSNEIGSLVGYISFLHAHVPALLLDANKNQDLIKELFKIYHPRFVWAPSTKVGEFSGYRTLFESEGYSLLQFDVSDMDFNPELALMLTTSGSTGSPKLVRLTLQNLLSNAYSIVEYLYIDENERPITSLPMYYSYGLSVVNSHLISGATLLLTNFTILQRDFWQFAMKYEATSISGVPYTYEMLRRLRFFRMNLPKLKTLTQAGGKLHPDLVKEFVEKANEQGKRFIVMYGQTEATARISYTPQEKALEKYKSIGVAIPNGKLFLIDVNGKEIAKSEAEGELVYQGPNVSLGYAECPEDLKKGDENKGELHTGDVAKFDSDGYFYITGRLKRFVKIWGNRCNLDSVEHMVKTITSNCACVGVDDKITVFVADAVNDKAIISMLCEKTGLNIRAFEVRYIDAIPKNTSGKVQYKDLQKLI